MVRQSRAGASADLARQWVQLEGGTAMSDPVPTDDYIASLWASVTEGLITWQELNGLQVRYLRTQEPIPIDIAAIQRRQVERNLEQARQRYADDPTDSARALVDYWQRQEERAQ
jgi:hypothetical protein